MGPTSAASQGIGMASIHPQRDRDVRTEKMTAPDFVIKYESVRDEPTPPGGFEEQLVGSESDAVAYVQALIEQGRTTPGRVQIYANVRAQVGVAVTFPPNRAR